jgi:hypothetical protein
MFALVNPILLCDRLKRGYACAVRLDPALGRHHAGFATVSGSRMARFLMTGGAGFMGSHLVNRLLEQGIQCGFLMICPQGAVRKSRSGSSLFRGM